MTLARVLALCAGLGAAAPLAAQQVSLYHLPSGDSAAVILTGDTGSVRLQVYTACLGLQAYTIRVYFDSDRLTVVAADSVPGQGFARPSRSDGADYVELTATGSSGNCTVSVAHIRFLLAAGATQGSQLSLRAVTLTNLSAGDLIPNHEAFLGQVCQAIDMWGDTDGSRTITSRDALVLLSAAVGLPTTGFSLLAGDVDADGSVNTRDALFTLSTAIGLYGQRAGRPRMNRCAPLAPAPADAAFFFNNRLWYMPAGDTVPQLVGFNPYYYSKPSWAPDGTRIVFTQSVASYSVDLISTTPDGSLADTLRLSTSWDYAPSWSPDGSRIAFISDRSYPYAVWTADPDGANQVQVTTVADSVLAYETAWTPDGSEIVFTGYHIGVTCCARRLWAVQPDGQGLREIPTAGLQPYDPAVAPAGDSVIFQSSSGDTYVTDLAGAGTPQRHSRLPGSQAFPQWLTAGRAFRSDYYYPYAFFIERLDGRILRWGRGGSGADWTYLRMRAP